MENRKLLLALVAIALVLGACAPAATPTPRVLEATKIVKETEVVLVTPTPPPPEPLPDTIKIGLFMPMTGVLAACGEEAWWATQYALKERPTVLGKPIEVVLVDNKSDKAESAVAMSRLIDMEKVHAVIGSAGSSFSMAGGEVSEEAGMPVLGTTCTNPLVTVGRPHYFRVCFTDDFAGSVMAKYAIEQLGAKTAVIIVDVQQDFCVGLANEFRKAFIELTGEPDSLLGMLSFQTGDRDFSAQLTMVENMAPDVVFAPDYFSESALMLQQARDLGVDTPFLGSDDWTHEEFLEIAGEAAEGVCFATHFHPDAFTNPTAEKFLSAYRAEHGGMNPSQDAILTYDAYLLMLDAIERAGSVDREAITKALSETTEWQGACGSVTLDENGDPVKPAVVLCVKGGEYVFDSIVEP